jgi:hypothetical protein
VELMAYGLTGMAAIAVTAFCFAYGDDLTPVSERYSFDLLNNAQENDSPIIETEAGSPQFRRKVGKQQKTAPASSVQKTAPDETGRVAIYSDGLQKARGSLEAVHG